MSSAAYFASAFQTLSATNSPSSSSYRTNRKRKRESAASENDAGGEEAEVPSSEGGLVTLSPVASGRECRSQDAAIQYEASGHPVGKALPGSNFPHAFRRRSTDSQQPKTKSTLSDGLTNLRPPLCVAAGSGSNLGNAKPGAVGLRQQHLIALTAILHKCVLEGDFIRAGRAWGMLLRAEHNGHSLDLRTTDRWGLGAEIIVRREAQLVRNQDGPGNPLNRHGTDDQHHMPGDFFDPQAFEQAKDYYERLALQYPYRKAFPHTTGPQDFYLAMFSLWIYSVQKQHSLALAEIGKGAADGVPTDAWVLDQNDMGRRQYRQRNAVRHDTLQRADVIAARFEELLTSPPYFDDTTYSQLQGMVNLWIEDLSNARNHSGSGDEDGNILPEGSNFSSGLDSEQIIDSKLEYGDSE